MPSLLVPSVPIYRNPQLRDGLAALVELLMDRDYSSHAIGRIFDFVACNGTLEGSLIEEEDMADAEAAFVDALPEIPFDSPAWGEPAAAALGLAPVCGGAPETYEPTPTEWAQACAMLRGDDAGAERAEALAFDRLADELASARAAEDRAPLYGYE